MSGDTLLQLGKLRSRAFGCSMRKDRDKMLEEVGGLDQDRMLVLSLKPRFAEAILAGVKTVELRRTAPKIDVPTRALLYATTPVRALLGTCVVTSVQTASLAVLWREHGLRSALAYREFQRYFKGLKIGTALTLAQPQSFNGGGGVPPRLAGEVKGFPPSTEFCLR
ncbi:MAG: ASCH domain-containing protein [Acidimicrobiia bacterium]|nr:ASCH domain-containing protein [Acidimicrobiia bacterium]